MASRFCLQKKTFQPDCEKASHLHDNQASRKWPQARRVGFLTLKIILLIIGVTKVARMLSFVDLDSITSDQISQPAVTLPTFYENRNRLISLNETLGFQNIIVLNLPKRTDRKDMMTLMGHASNLRLEFFPATGGEDALNLRLPKLELLDYLQSINFSFTPGQLGCYRSNLDLMRHIVENKIASTLVLQDDAEWDIDIKKAFARLQGPLQAIYQVDNKVKIYPTTKDPWMLDQWDMLWVGASYERPWPEPDTAPYVLYTDDTVASAAFEEDGGKKVFPAYGLKRSQGHGDPQYRLVQRSRRPLGMAAYAVTLAGASKILARAGTTLSQSFDNTVCAMSRPNNPIGYHKRGCHIKNPVTPADTSELRSFSVWPPLVSQFRDADGRRDSDLLAERPSGFHIDGSKGYALEIANGVRGKIVGQHWHWQ